ncbi:flagellar basal body P-ring formation chaperone FlgA [Starkeya koreensis]|uniref:Flagella basal body P-ring formation protein FlgA n=1 Tax=Ancylobacter koreensis TaxID=266121 RepID=A0ABT0DKU8_9HYPH|nr:flagellar basal body P-ring formation chaperone FlgA [Ancylobacter koreensis]MCK0207906.1 flagellar basal body P-ring formation chaperone FlgA [Ancylobacter koreensis]
MLRLQTGAGVALALCCALLGTTSGAFAQDRATLARQPIADSVAAAASTPEPPPAPSAVATLPPPPAELQLPVAASTIAAGETITDAMLAERPFPAAVATQYPVAVSRGQLVGKVARRTLLAGNLVPTMAVGESQLVTRGVAAEIRFEKDGLSISATGVPLESGVVGAVVRLKNADSGKIVTGVVQSDGSVRVGTP